MYEIIKVWDMVNPCTMNTSWQKITVDSEESENEMISMVDSVTISSIWIIVRVSTLRTIKSGLKLSVQSCVVRC
jgi:hypothetical protein